MMSKSPKQNKRPAVNKTVPAALSKTSKSLPKSSKQLPTQPRDQKTEHTSPDIVATAKEDRKKKASLDPNRSQVGNFNVIRDMIKEGSGGDYRWMLGLRNPRPFSSYKKINTAVQQFNFHESSPQACTSTKKQVVQFKPNGQSGEFNHLINRRRIKVANESMVAFETGLREYQPPKGKQLSNKGLPKEKFDCIPAVERKEFPQFILTKKDFEARKKLLPHIGEGLFRELTGLTGRPEVVYSAQDGRENYPPYQSVEKPDSHNVEPLKPSLNRHEVTLVKWAGDLRICRDRKNHKIRSLKYKEFQHLDAKDKQEQANTKAKKK